MAEWLGCRADEHIYAPVVRVRNLLGLMSHTYDIPEIMKEERHIYMKNHYMYKLVNYMYTEHIEYIQEVTVAKSDKYNF